MNTTNTATEACAAAHSIRRGTAGRAPLAARVHQWITRLADTARRRRERREAYRALRGLDDRMLKDIGISRSNITAIVEGSWCDEGPSEGVHTDAAVRRRRTTRTF